MERFDCKEYDRSQGSDNKCYIRGVQCDNCKPKENKIDKAVKVLEQHNKWRRDNNVPSKYIQQDPTEIGEAIDTILEFIKKTV